MNIIKDQQRRFSWDETPSHVFGDGLERNHAQRVRRSERELAVFLRQWCGTSFIPQQLRHD